MSTVITGDSGGTAITTTTLPTIPGTILQVVTYQTGAVATGTTLLPIDDTIPQSGEGDQYMSLAITPRSATSRLVINVVFNYACSGNDVVTVPLFQDSIASAVATGMNWIGVVNVPGSCVYSHSMISGTTSAITFKVRAGPNSGGTVTFNGHSGGRMYAGTYASSITIMEVAV